MSKVRIYELAKELGLENKALLDLCKQLGFSDKSSHSSSLSDDEADKIRRFVIRRAVNDKGPAIREVSREGTLLTESRLGSNVIRRRKKADSDTDEDETPALKQVDIEREVRAALSRDLPTLAPDPQAERLSREEALRQADALFRRPAEEPAVETHEGVPFDAAEDAPVATNGTSEHGAQHAAPQLAPAAHSLRSPEPAEQSEDESDTEPFEATDAAVELVESGAAAQAPGSDAVTAEAGTPEAGPVDGESLEDVRRRHDIRAPRILGKIELPIKTVPPKRPAPGARPGEERAAVGTDTDEASRGTKPKKKGRPTETSSEDEQHARRPKKKQVLRKDELLDYEGDRDGWRVKKGKKDKRGLRDGSDAAEVGPTRQSKKVVKVAGEISVGEFAKLMGVKVAEVMSHLMGLGVMAGINQLIDFDTATIVANELGYTTVNTEADVELEVKQLFEVDPEESRKLRPPVVTVMGHVDHGKTSLLDAIRQTSVTAGEVGGITQHIGAYNVVLPSGGSVTFLDTPGHEAFTAMRSRGAQVTDIVVLVVAADDGVMPQTEEAIAHAKAAGVPIIVAINKIDKEGANPDKVINQLSEHGLIPEDWGGDTIFVRVSAHTKENIDLLLENLHLQAEILELKANPDRSATGAVIESKLDRGRGPVITVLVQNGTLRRGDCFVAGAVSGRVRALVSDDGRRVEEAGPSIPVEVIGANATAVSGDDFAVFPTEAQARRVADERARLRRLKELGSVEGGSMVGAPLTMERFSEMLGSNTEMKELPIIIKADVQGSLEAVSEALQQLSNEEVRVKIIHRGVGAVTENDVQLAGASDAILVAFNVRPDARAAALIQTTGAEVMYSRIIYELMSAVDAALKGKRAPKLRETTLGRVEVRQTFKVPRQGTVAGSYVLDGTIPRGALIRLLRDNRVVYEGKMASLRRFKDDVREVQAGYECGIGIEGYSDIRNGDIIEVFKIEEVRDF